MTYRRDLRPVHGELARAGLLKDGERVWRDRPLAAWKKVATQDPRLATVLSGYVASVAGQRRLAIEDQRPAAYDRERTRLVAQFDGLTDDRQAVLNDLAELWHQVPYGVDPEERLAVLAWAKPRSAFARRNWGELVALAQELAHATPVYVLASVLPPYARPDAGALISSAEVAQRVGWLADEDLEALLSAVLHDEKLRSLARHYGVARFLRRCATSSALAVQMLLLSRYVSLRVPPAWESLRHTWDVVDELVDRLDPDDHDPFAARPERCTAIVTDEALEAIELLRLHALDEGSGPSPTADWERIYRGCAGLREVLSLLDAEGGPITVERLPMFPRRPTGERHQGVEPDGEQLDPDTQADLFVFGVRVLRSRPKLLRVWVVAWATICRSKECLPCANDLVALPGGGYAIFHDRASSKSGASEAIASARAVEVTGLRPSWFPARHSQRLSDAELHQHRALLQEACRAVRSEWEAAGRCQLPSQLSYFVRHAGADRLRWCLTGRHHVLTRVLRHLSAVSDFAYTKVSETELGDMLEVLADALSEILP